MIEDSETILHYGSGRSVVNRHRVSIQSYYLIGVILGSFAAGMFIVRELATSTVTSNLTNDLEVIAMISLAITWCCLFAMIPMLEAIRRRYQINTTQGPKRIVIAVALPILFLPTIYCLCCVTPSHWQAYTSSVWWSVPASAICVLVIALADHLIQYPGWQRSHWLAAGFYAPIIMTSSVGCLQLLVQQLKGAGSDVPPLLEISIVLIELFAFPTIIGCAFGFPLTSNHAPAIGSLQVKNLSDPDARGE